ncbi:unnamed protein product [Spirodela intermedia]|uniref:GATA-type domain-containing protein n=1 Tax=Spirodela intermedia TaxID=51605 RepID=A0A7I8JRR3_SPIIN|nr:unnamed protein product [Spirodela intermedia]CAA6672870.1 unnamed protein product [Spirodela intermedia]
METVRRAGGARMAVDFVEESFSGDDLHRLLLISGAAAKSSSPLSSGGRSELSTEPAAVTLPRRLTSLVRPAASAPAKAPPPPGRPAFWSSRLVTSSDDDGEKKEEAAIGLDGPNGQDGRRCLHCATDKTPQWRAGPMGPKTLCNACGVRFKSGRLVPEYRPAASPTFVPTRHSNSHRKVLELRRQKEIDPPATAARHLHPCGTYQHPPAAAADDFLIHARVGPDFRQLI